jgi:hypothetical protein
VTAIKRPQQEGVKRVNINIPIPLRNAFKSTVSARGENMTDVLMKFIEDYVAKNSSQGRRK